MQSGAAVTRRSPVQIRPAPPFLWGSNTAARFGYRVVARSLRSLANVIGQWLMGHAIGIAKHYLANNIKREYSNFEHAVRLS